MCYTLNACINQTSMLNASLPKPYIINDPLDGGEGKFGKSSKSFGHKRM